jgi:hypothetical protein
MFVLCSFVFFGAYILIDTLKGLFIGVSFVLLILTLGFLYFYNKKRTERFLSMLIGSLIPAKVKGVVRESFDSFFDSLPRKRKLAIPLMITIPIWILIFSQYYVIARSLNITINYFLVICIVPVATVIGLIPVTISGIGTREATLVSLFFLFGISPEEIMSMSIINLLCVAYIPAFIGWILSLVWAHTQHKDYKIT